MDPVLIAPELIGLPSLLRAARNTYGAAIRTALDAAGHDDIPGNGIYVIGAIAEFGMSVAQIIRGLAVSKQAAGQLIDTLVTRGYLERAVDAEDRRRVTLAATERGRQAASVTRAVVERIEGELVERVGADCVAHTRTTLMALLRLAEGLDQTGAGAVG